MPSRYFCNDKLLIDPPTKRAAYSDRTAWLLAELSALAYQPLKLQALNQRVASIMQAASQGDAAEVERLVLQSARHGHEELEVFEAEPGIDSWLEQGGFQLLECWSIDGSEALLVKRTLAEGHGEMLVLVFRGTQIMDKRDIESDLKAMLVNFDGGGRVHKGFKQAFERVEPAIREALQRHNGSGRYPLYIAGHSLGGALAVIATRVFQSDLIAATYTYGCPRVADAAFHAPIKSPIYRVVHSSDIIPRVPLGFGFNLLLTAIRLIPINRTRAISDFLEKHIAGYSHVGSLVFISGDGPAVNVKHGPDIFWQGSLIFRRWAGSLFKSGFTDHDKDIYRRKLGLFASKRV